MRFKAVYMSAHACGCVKVYKKNVRNSYARQRYLSEHSIKTRLTGRALCIFVNNLCSEDYDRGK